MALLAELTLAAPGWTWPAVVIVATGLAVLLVGYGAGPRAGGWRWLCAGLKIVALAALAWCLLDPQWATPRARPGANLFLVVADNSESLQIHDRGAAASRGAQARALLDPARGAFLDTLGASFDVRRYDFGGRLEPTADFHELDFSGRGSTLFAALRALGERYQGRPVAGIILLTDGNATDAATPPPVLAGLPPVYPVVLGARAPARDLGVQQVNVNASAFEDAPVAVQANVSAVGFRGETVVAQLTDVHGAVVAEQTHVPAGDDETLAFRFQLKPDHRGLSFYRVGVAARAGPAGPGPAAAEATLANNARVVVVDRGQGPYRILYVAGRPNWEYKFLSRAAAADEQLQLVGLIRVAKREPKFEFRGRAGETSNPLFRGFGTQNPEEVQAYDQPVLIRLNTKDDRELRAGFPRTREELYGFDAVVVGDLEHDFFSPEEAQLVQKFVSERGGGFLMLGGMESFQEGGYARTPIGDLLPVYLDQPAVAAAPSGPLRFQLAREGWLQPWARLRETQADERARLEAMPGFEVVNHVRALKPGASVIASLRDEGGAEIPALAVQRFGRGRAGALMIGDLWRWGMKDAAAHEDLDKAWRQLLRWLVADVPRRVEVAVEPAPGEAAGAVALQVRVRDANYLPLDDATVSLEVTPVNFGPGAAVESPLHLRAEAAAAEAGLFATTFVPRRSGGYRVTAIATNAAGAEVGRAEAGWSADLEAEEFRSLLPNVALLENLAAQTHGSLVRAEDLVTFARGLPQKKAPVMETTHHPLWQTPWVLALALGCLVAEWGIRRTKGLP